MPTVVWFGRDLRLADNPALTAAAARGPILPVFILDDEEAGDWAPGAASRWWLHRSLQSLAKEFGKRNLGRSHPRPIVGHQAARARALDRFKALKTW